MNKLKQIGCLAAAIVFASAATAQSNPDEHASHHPQAAQSASTELGKTADPALRMEENAKRMHDLMAKIRAEKNRTERQNLMRQHMAVMREQMSMMREEKDGSRDQPGPQQPGGMMNHGMMARHQMMQKRQDMMQMMMDQMLQHQEMRENSPTQRP
jgi:hypothetical protein